MTSKKDQNEFTRLQNVIIDKSKLLKKYSLVIESQAKRITEILNKNIFLEGQNSHSIPIDGEKIVCPHCNYFMGVNGYCSHCGIKFNDFNIEIKYKSLNARIILNDKTTLLVMKTLMNLINNHL
jgi:hypothetical protein